MMGLSRILYYHKSLACKLKLMLQLSSEPSLHECIREQIIKIELLTAALLNAAASNLLEPLLEIGAIMPLKAAILWLGNTLPDSGVELTTRTGLFHWHEVV